ncbi:GntR family transcriptional regulator [Rhodococcus sp. 15-725-2-2b]|uniref:MocR-like pyridoxine biosynthesis transcription factor PdxR n=1 Tax=unclassified Rhodococcus (in: high G+C Gram-positive bacteria) TaxID=192944 RepID=UPI000B9A980D|nr:MULTISPECIES: PLP-dependent aminotransferase family protein [unclassified Rhodococcus (in: high G+C Gram-positive bacteria)]OZC65900.1 GntR family transcriptional regulator [Rhodococcus sp. 06-469-3-2]OZD41526.1 GntR family transcriptional regulator [Rhodococcus sp. 06-1477-1A]OZE72122.1 GntR family transcriptional regulator [Rhodococcus sp. 15-725-2-2b]
MLPISLSITIDRADSRTLPVQLADRIRSAIDDGELQPDSRLPSTRALSVDLGIARAVVEKAYEQLVAEGWLDPRRGSGNYVRRIPRAGRSVAVSPSAQAPPRTPPRISLRPGIPWTPPSASDAWKRAWRDVGSTPPPADYPDSAGTLELRTRVAELLRRARGLHTTPASIVITTGSIHGLDLALGALSVAESIEHVLALENPGYKSAAALATHRGWSVHDVSVDGAGLIVEQLGSAPPRTPAVYVTPSHQYPTGAFMPIGRRRALADWARDNDSMIIEDDYDSEFRYGAAPLPTVAELAPDRTVYLGTVSKTLGAGIRLGWMVAPRSMVDRISATRRAIGDLPSVPVQQAMTSMLRDGEWDRAVRTARRLYRTRDRMVAAALARFGELRGVGAGLHTVLVLDSDAARAVATSCATKGVDVPTLEHSTRSPTARGGIVVGYGSVTDDELDYAISILVEALEAALLS